MVKRVAEQFGHLDILVNNAGITRDKLLAKMTDEDWLEVMQTNLNTVFFCTSAAMPIMTAQSYGRIINISSMNGQVGAFGQANYGASKGGIIAFTRTAALELAKSNITVNVVAPGFTETDMFAKVPDECRPRSRPRSRWAASASRRRSPRRWSSWSPTATTSPASRSTSTAACSCTSHTAGRFGDCSSRSSPQRTCVGHSNSARRKEGHEPENDTFNPFDPTGMFKSMRDAGMDAWSKMMIQLVNTEPTRRPTAR